MDSIVGEIQNYLAGAGHTNRAWLLGYFVFPVSPICLVDYIVVPDLVHSTPGSWNARILNAIGIVNFVTLIGFLQFHEEISDFLWFILNLIALIPYLLCLSGWYLYKGLQYLGKLAYDISERCCLLPFWLASHFVIIRPPRYRDTLDIDCVPGCKTHRGKLCSACELMIDSSVLLTGTRAILARPFEKHPHHTHSQLQLSAKTCHLCHLLLHSIGVSSGEGFPQDPLPGYGSIESVPQDWSTVKIWEELSIHLVHSLRMQICGASILSSTPLTVEEVEISLIHACEVTNDTGSNESLAFAKKCTLSCREHAICARVRPPFRPTRVLDVKPSATSNEIRLVETTDLPASLTLSYIALSHCWGGKIDFKLLESNREDMKRQIDTSSLARNFRDAISITRMLGERYLWIDSLCIIQDSLSDWETESSQMGQLYANSICTISATASKNSECGCILPKDLFFNDCTLRKQDKHSLVVRSWIHQDSSLDYLFSQKVDPAALNKRAWTFQEKILSRCVLNFCDGILLFECNAHRASEYHAEGVQHKAIATVQRDGTQNYGPRTIVHPAVERGRKYITRKTRSKRAPGIRTRLNSSSTVTYLNPKYSLTPQYIEVKQDESALLGFRGAFDMLSHIKRPVETSFQRLEIHRRWYELVRLYSSRELTEQKDKMMAILELGYAIEMDTGLKFVAGLWEEAMSFNLLWIPIGELKPRPVSVSLSTVTQYRRTQDLYLITHDLLNLFLATRALINSKILKVRDVPTWSWASVDRIIDEIVYSALIKDSESLMIHLDIKHIKPIIKHNSLIHHATLVLSGHLIPLDESSENFHPDIIIPDDDLAREIACLPILSFTNNLGEIEVHGIAVRGTSVGRAIYERVGYFWTNDVDVTKDILDNGNQKREFELM